MTETESLDYLLARLGEISPQARHGDDLELITHRDRMIRVARDQRATYAELAEATGLSRARLDQIIHERHRGARI